MRYRRLTRLLSPDARDWHFPIRAWRPFSRSPSGRPPELSLFHLLARTADEDTAAPGTRRIQTNDLFRRARRRLSDREFLCRNCGCNRLLQALATEARISGAAPHQSRSGKRFVHDRRRAKPDCLAFTQAVVFA